jgi:hypothetical protein
MTLITVTYHGDVCTFVIVYLWILLEIRNIWDKCCSENQNMFYVKYEGCLKFSMPNNEKTIL